MAPPACKVVSLDDCPIADELVSATAEKMHRRKDDPVIDGIHNRLDTLEDLAAGIPAKTRVVSGGGTASVVLSRAATDTAAGKTLYWGA